MISSFRNFAKTKFAGLLVFIMIIPFVFWGMGSMFSSGNTNNIVKINKKNISTQDFIDHIRLSNISEKIIRENLDKNIIEELLSTLISTSLLDLEIENFNIIVSEDTLLKMIKTNKNFTDENGNFERIKYEKFLLNNNISAPGYELNLKDRKLQKKLFDYIGAGTAVPNFLAKKQFIENNRKLELEFIDLKNFYEKKENISNSEIIEFIKDNNDQLKVEYLDFEYAILNPKNLIGMKEFNQTFFDKIDEIEIDISNDLSLKSILDKFNIPPVNVSNFRMSSNTNLVEKKIFEARNIKFDIIESENDFILYKIKDIKESSPDINDPEMKKELIELIFQKNKFEYNNNLLKKIDKKNFNLNEFKKMGENLTQSLILNSIKDNKIFDTNAVELLYSLPQETFTLVNDKKNNIYIVRIKRIDEQKFDIKDKNFKDSITKQNMSERNSILKTYDLFLNNKYNVVLNQKTIERVKNFFQ